MPKSLRLWCLLDTRFCTGGVSILESPPLCFGSQGLLLRKRVPMITVISPAKTLDFETAACTSIATTPDFLDEAAVLIHKLKTISAKKLMELMDISKDLSTLNVERYQQFETGKAVSRGKQAVLAFHGDVYQGMTATDFTESDFEFAQDHLRILSGLYGVLRPLDMIQPYRLEMGTQLKVGRRKNLYAFWNERVTNALNATIAASGSPVLLNLASEEYFGAVDAKCLKARLVTPRFLDLKGKDYKVVSFWAKRARGKMAAWIISNRINQVEDIQQFGLSGYRFNAERSTGDSWAFTRDTPQD